MSRRRLKHDIKAKITRTDYGQTTIAERRNTLRSRIRKFQTLQAIYMPGLLQYLTDLQRTAPTTSDDGGSHVHAEDMDLWLPSMLPIHLRQHICIQIEDATDGLPEIEKKLRQAQCHSALDSLRRALRLKSHMVDWRNHNARGQREGLRSRVQIDRINRDCTSATAKYRAARIAFEKLSDGQSIAEEFPPLLDSDVRSYADPDLEANKKKKRSYVGREEGGNDEEENIDELQEIGCRPAGESRRVISWIWRHKVLSSLLADDSGGLPQVVVGTDVGKRSVFILQC